MSDTGVHPFNAQVPSYGLIANAGSIGPSQQFQLGTLHYNYFGLLSLSSHYTVASGGDYWGTYGILQGQNTGDFDFNIWTNNAGQVALQQASTGLFVASEQDFGGRLRARTGGGPEAIGQWETFDSNCTAQNVGASGRTITWTNPPAGADHYVISITDTQTCGWLGLPCLIENAVVPGSATSFTPTQPNGDGYGTYQPGHTYNYRIREYSADGQPNGLTNSYTFTY